MDKTELVGIALVVLGALWALVNVGPPVLRVAVASASKAASAVKSATQTSAVEPVPTSVAGEHAREVEVFLSWLKTRDEMLRRADPDGLKSVHDSLQHLFCCDADAARVAQAGQANQSAGQPVIVHAPGSPNAPRT